MLRFRWFQTVAAIAASFATSARAVTFEQIAGWWKATASYDGRSTEAFVEFIEEDAKQMMKVSLPAISVWGEPCGTLKIEGDRIHASDLSFPLEYDEATRTLSGNLPKDAVPVYKIPVRFERCEIAPVVPEPLKWEYPQPREKWTTQLEGPFWAGLANDATGELIIVAGENGAVTALRDSTGEKAWEVKVGGPIRARPTITGDAVLVVSDDGNLYRLRLADGGETWRSKIDAGSPPRLEPTERHTRYDRYASSAIVRGERIYVGCRDGGLYALNAADGERLWRAESKDMVIATPVVFGDLVLFGSFDGFVRGVDAATGEMKWEHDAQGAVAGDLVVSGEHVLIGTRTYDLRSLDARTGKRIWNFYYWFSWIESPPVVADGVAYVGSSDALRGYGFDAATGKLKWEQTMPGWTWPQPVVFGDAVVFAATGSRNSHRGMLVACDRKDGRILWTQPGVKPENEQSQWGFASTPIVVGETIIAAELGGRISAYAKP